MSCEVTCETLHQPLTGSRVALRLLPSFEGRTAVDPVLEALHTLTAVAALARPDRKKSERLPWLPPLKETARPAPPGPLGKRQPLPVRFARLFAHLDRERFRA